MSISLEGRTAIVTGGGSGLGMGYAKALAEAGAAVAVTGRRQEPLDECVSAIEKSGGRALAVTCDQRSREEAKKLEGLIDFKRSIFLLDEHDQRLAAMSDDDRRASDRRRGRA